MISKILFLEQSYLHIEKYRGGDGKRTKKILDVVLVLSLILFILLNNMKSFLWL